MVIAEDGTRHESQTRVATSTQYEATKPSCPQTANLSSSSDAAPRWIQYVFPKRTASIICKGADSRHFTERTHGQLITLPRRPDHQTSVLHSVRCTHQNMNETPYDRLKSTALELPEVQEATSYGTPALKVRGKLMLRLREDGTIAFRTTWEQREELIEMYPKVFFVNDHFRKYDWTLARIENLYEGQIRQIVHTAWCNTAPKAVRKELLR